jgi:hypothetical protein
VIGEPGICGFSCTIEYGCSRYNLVEEGSLRERLWYGEKKAVDMRKEGIRYRVIKRVVSLWC